ncbi:MAG: hypothetical protein WCO60_08950 [Verrucomicrobiota bacterium]
MNHKRFLSLIDAWREEQLTEEEAAELSQILRDSEDARRIFKDEANMHGLLHRAVMASSISNAAATLSLPDESTFSPTTRPQRPWLVRFFAKPFLSAAAGILVGVFCTSVLWAVSEPKILEPKRLPIPLADTSKEGRIPSGFPTTLGILSGDHSELVSSGAGRTKKQGKLLRFIQAESDNTNLDKVPKSCDVFQIVDLSAFRDLGRAGKATLEFSASFADTRASSTAKLRFCCRLFVFQGKPTDIENSWPVSAHNALASSSQYIDLSQLSGPNSWNSLKARCIFPENADFAVVQIVASEMNSPSLEPAQFGAQFADELQLVLKIQP